MMRLINIPTPTHHRHWRMSLITRLYTIYTLAHYMVLDYDLIAIKIK